MKTQKKELNFELNLIPMIDILSVCTCFLLMTVMWIQIGSIDVNQTLGATGKAGADHDPAVWMNLEQGGQIVLNVRNARLPAKWSKMTVSTSQIDGVVAELKRLVPTLKNAVLLPVSRSQYQDVVIVMDSLKHSGITDIGITPL